MSSSSSSAIGADLILEYVNCSVLILSSALVSDKMMKNANTMTPLAVRAINQRKERDAWLLRASGNSTAGTTDKTRNGPLSLLVIPHEGCLCMADCRMLFEMCRRALSLGSLRVLATWPVQLKCLTMFDVTCPFSYSCCSVTSEWKTLINTVVKSVNVGEVNVVEIGAEYHYHHTDNDAAADVVADGKEGDKKKNIAVLKSFVAYASGYSMGSANFMLNEAVVPQTGIRRALHVNHFVLSKSSLIRRRVQTFQVPSEWRASQMYPEDQSRKQQLSSKPPQSPKAHVHFLESGTSPNGHDVYSIQDQLGVFMKAIVAHRRLVICVGKGGSVLGLDLVTLIHDQLKREMPPGSAHSKVHVVFATQMASALRSLATTGIEWCHEDRQHDAYQDPCEFCPYPFLSSHKVAHSDGMQTGVLGRTAQGSSHTTAVLRAAGLPTSAGHGGVSVEVEMVDSLPLFSAASPTWSKCAMADKEIIVVEEDPTTIFGARNEEGGQGSFNPCVTFLAERVRSRGMTVVNVSVRDADNDGHTGLKTENAKPFAGITIVDTPLQIVARKTELEAALEKCIPKAQLVAAEDHHDGAQLEKETVTLCTSIFSVKTMKRETNTLIATDGEMRNSTSHAAVVVGGGNVEKMHDRRKKIMKAMCDKTPQELFDTHVAGAMRVRRERKRQRSSEGNDDEKEGHNSEEGNRTDGRKVEDDKPLGVFVRRRRNGDVVMFR